MITHRSRARTSCLGPFITIISGIVTFERELIQERIRSGIAAAKARGKKLGRQPGQRPKSDRLAPKVLSLVAQGRSYRLIGRELGLSKNTVAAIKRHRTTTPTAAEPPQPPMA
jgi:putative DNA-invertase from lambdoid prophage Rac